MAEGWNVASEGGGGGSLVSPSTWEACIARVCGGKGCLMGEGVYAPQLATWRLHAPSFPYLLLPKEGLGEASITRVFQALSLPTPSDLPCMAAQLREWLRSNETRAPTLHPPLPLILPPPSWWRRHVRSSGHFSAVTMRHSEG